MKNTKSGVFFEATNTARYGLDTVVVKDLVIHELAFLTDELECDRVLQCYSLM